MAIVGLKNPVRYSQQERDRLRAIAKRVYLSKRRLLAAIAGLQDGHVAENPQQRFRGYLFEKLDGMPRGTGEVNKIILLHREK